MGIKAVSVLFVCNAIVLLVGLLYGYLDYIIPGQLAIWIQEILGTLLGPTATPIGTIPSALGISYVAFVALIISQMQSSFLLALVLLTFAALYIASGAGLMKCKSWARKVSITLLVTSIFGGLLIFLLVGFLLSGLIGVLLSGAVLYYLIFSKEGKAFFAKKN